ncbi:AAA family ATPase [Trinickia mobilis]|uniref:AAA family ATPase n=1 Tax=Trinickia mobilis TaxID=2816356 RepID=UPI001A902349|nr:ATP-binding protein [Trinickia mobilis]
MLVQFTTENFLCFKDEATISMVAAKRRSKDKALDAAATFDASDELKLLKCAALYGANGSGKSSLFKAIHFMKKFVLDSSKESQADEKIKVTPFRLSAEIQNAPSRFEIIFVWKGYLYQYGFSADENSIHTESLTRKSIAKGREESLFKRVHDRITVYKRFSEGEGLQNKTRKNALFLSACANFDGKISTEVVRWFRTVRVISGLTDEGLFGYTSGKLGDAAWNGKIRNLLKDFDLGIERLEVGAPEANLFADPDFPAALQPLTEALGKLKITPAKTVATYHRSFDGTGNIGGEVAFDLKRDESEGTKKLVSISAPLIDVLEKYYILIFDEFDARLHPIITKNIIKLFNSSEINVNHAQLLVVTHDTNLLDRELMRRDQVWFTERDYYGASHLTSLVEYKVRNDASYEKDYITGKYGAIPIVGDIKRVFGPFTSEESPATQETD